MTLNDNIHAHLQYRVPAVRHLAWMCHAPQLIHSPLDFSPAEYLTEESERRLKEWDKNPESGPGILTDSPPRRLGQYFERLYECLLQDLLGWNILLKNQPIRNNGLTLGELDFIVRNPADQAIEHHEIAVKFYLGYWGDHQVAPLWYGPNARDRLDLKSDRLLSHQCRLTEAVETRNRLTDLGIPTPDRVRAFMPGYLFYPVNESIQPPENVPANHLHGQWIYLDQMDMSDDGSEADQTVWVPLHKPHWLGPWQQEQHPDPLETQEALRQVRESATPRLFAVMKQLPDESSWQEINRLFVVPSQWPGQ
ncbi:DUF1853 family protein [Marinobacter sp. CHS3-4]|uniref:DUF1853 family protein n=1 Tax=Marinobacter sp. CHS3-4 TaxID=3045174 RepID=UPI0024B4D619|nr:DUF1853 family protein [Marinobacter sp. CHS3-4]MDI9245086.1 DUF1853 family protein [Marinobacter sp. CHS3-4]